MDLVIGHANGPDGFSTCMFAGNYNQSIESRRIFTSMSGERIQILAVFLGKGSNLQEIHGSLQTHVECNIVGWCNASPGQITDTVHHTLAPTSLANNFARSVDQLLTPVESKSDVPASKPDATDAHLPAHLPDGGKKTRVRVRKPR